MNSSYVFNYPKPISLTARILYLRLGCATLVVVRHGSRPVNEGEFCLHISSITSYVLLLHGTTVLDLFLHVEISVLCYEFQLGGLALCTLCVLPIKSNTFNSLLTPSNTFITLTNTSGLVPGGVEWSFVNFESSTALVATHLWVQGGIPVASARARRIGDGNAMHSTNGCCLDRRVEDL